MRRVTRQIGWLGAPVLCAFMFYLSGHVAAIASPEKSYEYQRSAEKFFSDGQYDSAVIELKNALQQDPDNLAARVLLGRTYLAMGRGANAEEELRQAQTKGADESLIIVPLGEALLMQGKFDALLKSLFVGRRAPFYEMQIRDLRGKAYLGLKQQDAAAREFQAAAKAQPSRQEPLIGLTRVAINLGRKQAALDYSEQAVTLGPDDAESWFVRGEALRQDAQAEAAVEAYGQALAREEDHVLARMNRAAVLIGLDRKDEAAADIRRLVEREPQNLRYAYLNAVVMARQGDLNAARADLERARGVLARFNIGELVKQPEALLLAGMIEAGLGNVEQARVRLERYVAINPRHGQSRLMLARIYLQQNRRKSALDVLRPLFIGPGTRPEVYGLAGVASMALGEHETARRYLERAVELAPDNVEFRTQLGISLLRTGRREAAVKDLQAAFADSGSSIRPGVILAMHHLSRGENAAAYDLATAMAQRQPDSSVPYNIGGNALLGQGVLDAARIAFEEALSRDPDYLPAHYNLANVDLLEGKLDAAEGRLEAVARKHGREVKALQMLVRIAFARRDGEAAALWLEKIRALDPTNSGATFDLVRLYRDLKQPQKSIQVAEDFANRVGTPSAREMLGRAQMLAGRTEIAQRTFRALARANWKEPDDLFRAAQLQEAAGDLVEAKQSLQRVRELDPAHQGTQTSLVRNMLARGEDAAAAELARSLVESHPDRATGYVLLGDIAMWRDDYAQATTYYTKAYIKEQNWSITRRLFLARRANGVHDAGLLESSCQQQDERRRDCLLLLADAYRATGKPSRAIQVYQDLLSDAPNDAGVINNLADAYVGVNNERAEQLARRALALEPDSPVVMDTLGWILVGQGEFEEAVRLLQRAHVRLASNPLVKFHLAVALRQNGENSEADRLFREIIAVAPGSEVAKNAEKQLE